MTNLLLLTIPTVEPLDLWQKCISSFSPSLIKSSALALVVYNGPDITVPSEYSYPHVIKLGFKDSKCIAQKFADIADCSEELLFGKQEYGRSYGGAANLLLALAHALGASTIGKIDDDCLEFEPRPSPWLFIAARDLRKDTIHFGPYIGQPTGFLHEFDETTSSQLQKYIYGTQDQKNHPVRPHLDTPRMKNGNLVFPVNATHTAPYPVLYDSRTHIHARGEVYYWASELGEHGFTFKYEDLLKIRHSGSTRNTHATWIHSLVLAFDLSLVHRTYVAKGKRPTLSERHKAILRFKSWILNTQWPKDVIVEKLAKLLDEAAIDFTENFYSNLPKRKLAWEHLMQADLAACLEELLPEVIQKVRTPSCQFGK